MATASRIEGIAGGSRGSGGITGSGGKYVNPKYKEVGPTVKVVKANPETARNLQRIRNIESVRKQEQNRISTAQRRLNKIESE
jgi:5-enolpyruvylshikimate-3-phosphate synthase